MAMVWLWAPTALLQVIYAKYYGMSLAVIASVVLLARVFDALTDPLIGYWSDGYYQRHGTRKPFVLIGGILLIISGYFLYVPYGVDINVAMEGEHPGGSMVSAVYFSIWFLIFYFAYTMFDIPHNAWATDLAESAKDKSKIYSFRGASAYLGLIFFYAIPLTPFFESTEITPTSLRVSVIAASVLMLLFLYVAMRYTPGKSSVMVPVSVTKSGTSTKSALSIINERTQSLKSIVSNKPFCLFILAYIFNAIGFGLWYGLIFLYVDSYLNVGEQFAPMFLIGFIVGLVAIPIWYKLSVLIGKKRIIVISLTLSIVSYAYTGLLVPGEVSFEQLLYLKIINSLGDVCMATIIPAMLSEISDYGTLKNKNANSGLYFSLYLFVSKGSAALGMALGLAIAGWFGYDAAATAQSPDAVWGLMLSMVWLSSISVAIGLVLFALNPINARRHRIIRRRLDSLAMRASRDSSSLPESNSSDLSPAEELSQNSGLRVS